MKPLHLKISGLNSFREEQEVDFTSLSESGVFGIFGPTGSGKSSVLDAITLALYGKVERAKGGTQGIINQNEEKLYVYFAFKVGGKYYTAERTYKRGNDGSINQQSCRLLEIDEGENIIILAEKKREMDEKVQEILGLTVDDFTRAVVLPQGKFQEFLTLQGAERRKMLQRIFALEKYGERLVKKIRERTNQGQLELGMKNHELEMLGDASEAAIKKAQKDVQEKNTKLLKIEEKLTLLKKEWEEYKEIRQLTKDLGEADGLLAKLAQIEPEINIKRDKLDLAQRGEYLRPYLKQVTDGEEALLAKTKEYEKLEEELRELQSHCTQLDGEYKAWESKYQNEGKALEGQIIKLEGALEDEKIRDGYFEKLQELKNNYKKLEEIIKIQKEDIAGLTELKKQKEKEKKSVDQKLQEKELIIGQSELIEKQKEAWQGLLEATSRLEEVAKELEDKEKQRDLREKEKNQMLETSQGYENSLAQIKANLENLPQAKLSLEEIYKEQTRLHSLRALIEVIRENENLKYKREQELEENKNLILQQEDIIAQGREFLEKLRAKEARLRSEEKENYVQSLRETLVSGQPCPVCGSLEHPTTNSSKDLLVQELLKENDLPEKIAKENKALVSAEAQLEVLLAKNSELKGQIQELDTRLQNSRASLPESWRLEKSDNLTSLINDAEDNLNQDKETLEKNEKLKEGFQKELKEMEQKLNILGQKLSGVKAEINLIFNDQQTTQEKYNYLLEVKNSKEESFKSLAGGKTGEEVEKLFDLLKTSRLESQKLQTEKNRVLQKIDELISKQAEVEKELQENEQELRVLETDGRTYRKLYNDLNVKILQITGGVKALEAKLTSQEQLQVLVENLNKFKKELETAKNNLEVKTRAFHAISQEITNNKHSLEKYQEALQIKMAEYQFISLGQLKDALCTENEREKLTVEIKKFNEEKLLAEDRKKALIIKLANRSCSEEEWDEFLAQKTQAEEEEKREREEGYRLKLNLRDLEEKHDRWKQLVQETKDLTGLLDQLSLLDKLFKGNTFVEFIAEEQLMHVAIDASRRLGELTNYRYALEVDSEGGFIIRDDANGGLKRPVTTLSGGETFLTSLALALALSSQIQLRGKYPLEFFFLDEGFGTLDNHLLETVMNSLERLQLERMTIGIISHVPELKARIPRSLIVEPAEKGGRGTRLCLAVG